VAQDGAQLSLYERQPVANDRDFQLVRTVACRGQGGNSSIANLSISKSNPLSPFLIHVFHLTPDMRAHIPSCYIGHGLGTSPRMFSRLLAFASPRPVPSLRLSLPYSGHCTADERLHHLGRHDGISHACWRDSFDTRPVVGCVTRGCPRRRRLVILPRSACLSLVHHCRRHTCRAHVARARHRL